MEKNEKIELEKKINELVIKAELNFAKNNYISFLNKLGQCVTELYHEDKEFLTEVIIKIDQKGTLFQKCTILSEAIFHEINLLETIPLAQELLRQRDEELYSTGSLEITLERFLKNKTDSSYPRMIQRRKDSKCIEERGEYNLANIVAFMDEELEKGRDIWTLSGAFRWRYTLKKFFDEVMNEKALEYFQNPKNTFALLNDAADFPTVDSIKPSLKELEQFLKSININVMNEEELKVFNELIKNLQELIIEKKYYDKLNFFIPDGPVTKDKPKTMDEIESFIDKELKEGKTLESLDKKMAYKYIIKMFLDSTMGDGMSSFYSNEIQYKDFLMEATLNLRGFKRLYDKLIKVDAILKQADLTELNEEQQKLFDKLCDQVEDLIEDGFYEKLDR